MSDADGKRPRQDDGHGPDPKRPRESAPASGNATPTLTNLPSDVEPAVSRLGLKPQLPELPPSLELVTGSKPDLAARQGFVGEADVGIIGYVGDASFQGVQGVIKQRCISFVSHPIDLSLTCRYTDFLVNEISLDSEILHLKDIGKPVEPEPEPSEAPKEAAAVPAPEQDETDVGLPAELQFATHANWSQKTTVALRSHFDDKTIISLHALLVEGKNPPPKQDSGWGSRPTQRTEQTEEEMALNIQEQPAPTQGRDRGKGRGGRQGGKGGRDGPWKAEDTREVVSQVIAAKDSRTAAHGVIREQFNGTFETSSREAVEGQCLVIKWSSARQGRQDRKRQSRPPPPPYICLV